MEVAIMNQIDVAIIGTGWCGGIRAEWWSSISLRICRPNSTSRLRFRSRANDQPNSQPVS